MIFRQFLNEPIAALSYLVGCVASGEAAVVDPSLPPERYILAAADHGLRIRAVLETHMHADYISTGRALAAQTKAEIYIPEAADVSFTHRALSDGDRVHIGNVTVRALHTPGHTPEHMAFAVSDGPRSHQPWFVLTGDCLFVGDVGRADLIDLPNTGTDPLYTSLFDKLMCMPDYVEIFPAHYGGSACGGKQMSGKLSSTIGYERRFNWALQAPDRKTFGQWVSANPRADVEDILLHRNTNRGELALPEDYYEEGDSLGVDSISPQRAARYMSQGIIVVDLRHQHDFVTEHPKGALNITYNPSILANRVAALVPAGETILCFADQPIIARAAAQSLSQSERNPISGYIDGDEDLWHTTHLPTESLTTISIDELSTRIQADNTLVLDVRDPSEWERGIIAGARMISINELREQLSSLPRNVRIITICESGARATSAASLLRHHGFPDVAAVASQGMSAYAQRYPTVVPSNIL